MSYLHVLDLCIDISSDAMLDLYKESPPIMYIDFCIETIGILSIVVLILRDMHYLLRQDNFRQWQSI